MIAYNFKIAFAPQLANGEKTLTMRSARKPPSRHAEVGEPIGLWTGMRTKEATRRGVGLVILTCLLRFNSRGLHHASDLRLREPVDGATEQLALELRGGEDDAFARRDGFENWAGLWAWHVGHAGNDELREALAGGLVRHLIAWRPLDADQTAAIDAGIARLEEVA